MSFQEIVDLIISCINKIHLVNLIIYVVGLFGCHINERFISQVNLLEQCVLCNNRLCTGIYQNCYFCEGIMVVALVRHFKHLSYTLNMFCRLLQGLTIKLCNCFLNILTVFYTCCFY